MGSLSATAKYFGGFAGAHMAYIIGTFVSGTCYRYCSYLQQTVLPTGYDQAEIFLIGWQAENLGSRTTLRKLMLSAKSIQYDPITGKFDWEAAADIRAAVDGGDEYRFILYFVIVLTKQGAAQLSLINNGCFASKGGQCKGKILVPNVVPPGWDFLALAVRQFNLEALPGTLLNGITLNRLVMDVSHWSEAGTNLVSSLYCAMDDGTQTVGVQCQVDAIGITAAPGEALHTLFSNFDASLLSFFSSSGSVPPPLPGLTLNRSFGGLEGFSLGFPAGQTSMTWSWAANYNDIGTCINKIDFCYDRIGFLGDQKGSVNTLPFEVENRGFAIWILKP